MCDLVQFYLIFILSVDSNGCDGAYEAFIWKQRELINTLLVLTQKPFLFEVWKGGKSLSMSSAIVWMASASMQSNRHGGKIIPSETEDRRRIHSEKKDRLHINGHTQSHTHTHSESVWHKKALKRTPKHLSASVAFLPSHGCVSREDGLLLKPSVSVELICLRMPGNERLNLPTVG